VLLVYHKKDASPPNPPQTKDPMQLYWQKKCNVTTTDLIPILPKTETTITALNALKNRVPLFSILDPQIVKTPLSTLLLPLDAEYRTTIINAAKKKSALKPDVVVLIGIGGSNLGAWALHDALRTKLIAEGKELPLFYCADTIGGDKTSELLKTLDHHLTSHKRVELIIVSKSGTTLETSINAALCTDLLKKHYATAYTEMITVITDRNSPLWHQAENAGFLSLEIPPQVGGRYSVFSAVGLFPLALMGFDVDALCAGASKVIADLSATTTASASLTASILYILNRRTPHAAVIHDTFLFDSSFELLGKWYRQLSAESLGKRYTLSKELIQAGLLPTVSIGTVDLHSLFQFYLGGPRNNITTFITVEQINTQLAVPNTDPELPAANMPLSQVVDALAQSVQQVYEDDERPFMTIHLQKTEWDLGAFMQMKMIETVLLAGLLDIDPFDQPEVERYKKEARLLLKL